MGSVQSLIVSKSSITPFQIPFKVPFSFAGNTLSERTGFYLNLTSREGLLVQSEAAPLPGVSPETLKHCRHELEEIQKHLQNLEIATQAKQLINQIRQDLFITSLCPSAKCAVESALFLLAAKSQNISLIEFLGGTLTSTSTAVLLQGTYEQVLNDAKAFVDLKPGIFKLKVGDRNIPLDVKKVNDLRKLLGSNATFRLDGNRVWSLNEAILFTELVGHQNIAFLEEPLSDMSRLNTFYEKTHFPVALDETLAIVKCGINAPGRCSPTLAHHEAVKAYVLKPMILGGIVPTLEWIEEAKSLGKKSIISSTFESSVGLKILANLSLLTGEIPGLGTDRWLNQSHLANPQGIIDGELVR